MFRVTFFFLVPAVCTLKIYLGRQLINFNSVNIFKSSSETKLKNLFTLSTVLHNFAKVYILNLDHVSPAQGRTVQFLKPG